MALVATARAVDRYTLKLLITHTGGTGAVEDDLTIANATLVALMVEGPLKDLWSQAYASLDAARLALLEGEHMEVIGPSPIRGSALGAGENAPWATDVSLVGTAAGLTIFGDATGVVHMLQLNYRHSTGR